MAGVDAEGVCRMLAEIDQLSDDEVQDRITDTGT